MPGVPAAPKSAHVLRYKCFTSESGAPKNRKKKNGHTSGWSGKLRKASATSLTRMKWSVEKNQLISSRAVRANRKPVISVAALRPVRVWSLVGRHSNWSGV